MVAVTVWALRTVTGSAVSVLTETSEVAPLAVSVTTHSVPAGRSSNVVVTSSSVPAGMVTVSFSSEPSGPQVTCRVTSPCRPAASPAMTLVTASVPGVKPYVLTAVSSAPAPAGMVTGSEMTVSTDTVAVAPLSVSVRVHSVPAGRSSKVEVTVSTVPAGMVTVSSRTEPSGPQLTCSTTSPCSPAAAPANSLVTASVPGAKVYVLVTVPLPVPPAVITTGAGSSLLTRTDSVAPVSGSVTEQVEPAGMLENWAPVVSVVPAGTPTVSSNTVSPSRVQSTSISTVSWFPAASPAITLVSSNWPGFSL